MPPAPPRVDNHLSRIRQARGLGAADLAARVGANRQTIYAIEAGTYVPNTLLALRLAQALEVRVEDLFSLASEQPAALPEEPVDILPDEAPPHSGQLLQICRVENRLVAAFSSAEAWSLPPADGVLAEPSGRKPRARLFRGVRELGQRLLVAGCDPGISVLARHLQRAGVELVVAPRNSTQALALLDRGLVHLAGAHLGDESGAESNLAAVKRLLPGRALAIVAVARWEEGFVVAAGNPKQIRRAADLAKPDVAIVNRELGAGSRLLLDSHLESQGIAPESVRGYDRLARGHLPAAAQVSAGQADVCLATRAAARFFGLDFVPLSSRRYDLVLRRKHLDLPAMETLLDILGRTSFRRELEALGGYDAREAGQRKA